MKFHLRRIFWSAMTPWIRVGLVALVLVGGAPVKGFAADDRTPATPQEDPAYTQAVSAIKKGDYTTAVQLLESVVAKDDKNANAYNWVGYATRQSGDAAKAIPLYEKALAIDPKHRGAHEYIGEAYLILGDLQKAKAHLARLDKLCFFPCSEYTDLKKAVEAYESSAGQIKPTSKRVP